MDPLTGRPSPRLLAYKTLTAPAVWVALFWVLFRVERHLLPALLDCFGYSHVLPLATLAAETAWEELPPGVAVLLSYGYMVMDLQVAARAIPHLLPLAAWFARAQFGCMVPLNGSRLRRGLANTPFELGKAKQNSNPHWESAHRRKRARRHLLQLVRDQGMVPYMISMSNLDVAEGLLGSRPLLTVKDAISYHDPALDKREDDPVPANAAFLLIDVDYHVSQEQLAELVSRGRPVYIYTFAPKSLATRSDGIDIEYRGDGLWSTAMPDNPYLHPLWDWNNEHRYLWPSEKYDLFATGCKLFLALAVAYSLYSAYQLEIPLDPGVIVRGKDYHWTKRGCYRPYEGYPIPGIAFESIWDVYDISLDPAWVLSAVYSAEGMRIPLWKAADDPSRPHRSSFLNYWDTCEPAWERIPGCDGPESTCTGLKTRARAIEGGAPARWHTRALVTEMGTDLCSRTLDDMYELSRPTTIRRDGPTPLGILTKLLHPYNYFAGVLKRIYIPSPYVYEIRLFTGWPIFAVPTACRTREHMMDFAEKYIAARIRNGVPLLLLLLASCFAVYCLVTRDAILLRVERMPCGESRELVLLLPLRRFSPFQNLCFLSSRHGQVGMERLEPTVLRYTHQDVTNQYAAMRVLRVGGATTSFMRLGSHLSFDLSDQQRESIIAVIRALGKRPAGTTAADLLKRAGLKATTEEAIQITASVAAFEGVNPVEVSALDRLGNALMHYEMGPSLSADVPRPTLRPFMHHIFGNGAPVPARTPVNTAAGIEIRVKRPRNMAVPTDHDLLIADEFLRLALADCEITDADGFNTSCFDAEEVLERQPRPTQQALLFEPVQCSDPLSLAYGFRASVKPKETTKKPRMITVPSESDYKLHSSALGYRVTRAMKRFSWFYSGKNFRQTAESIVEMFIGAETEGELDFSNMDGSHGMYEFISFRNFVFAVTPQDDHPEVEAILSGTFWQDVHSSGGKYNQQWALGSGLWLTTIYNTWTGALMSFRARRKLCPSEGAALSYQRIGGHSGDDSILRDVPDPDEMIRVYEELGHKITVAVFPAGSRRVSFLARIYDTRDGSSVLDAMRWAKKMHLTGLPASVTPANVAAMRFAAVAFSDLDVPVVGDITRKVLTATAPKILTLALAARGGQGYDDRGTISTTPAAAEASTAILRGVSKRLESTGVEVVNAVGYLPYQSMLCASTPIPADWAREYIEDIFDPDWIRQIDEWCADDAAPWDAPPTVHVFAPMVAPNIEGASVDGFPMRNDTDVVVPAPPPASVVAAHAAAFETIVEAPRASDAPPGLAAAVAANVSGASYTSPPPLVAAINRALRAQAGDTGSGVGTFDSDGLHVVADVVRSTTPAREDVQTDTQLNMLRGHPLYAKTRPQALKQHWGRKLRQGAIKQALTHGPLEQARFASIRRATTKRFTLTEPERVELAALDTPTGRIELALLQYVARVAFFPDLPPKIDGRPPAVRPSAVSHTGKTRDSPRPRPRAGGTPKHETPGASDAPGPASRA